MASSFFKQKQLSCETYTLYGMWFYILRIIGPVFKCPKLEQDKTLIEF